MTTPVLRNYDSQIYSVEAIQKAAYRCINQIAVELSADGNQVACRITPNIGVTDNAFSLAVEEFQKHVLDYQLRNKIKVESEPLRNLILGVAFSRTSLHNGG